MIFYTFHWVAMFPNSNITDNDDVFGLVRLG